ncbi:MAG: hypothetical protein HWE23_00925 [Rhodobacteraceae bacterium]|nr:hypothetical protein [Paracoccaceae bacterium]
MIKPIIAALLFITIQANAQKEAKNWQQLDKQTPLKEYIENQAYEYLNFNPEERDSIDVVYKELVKTNSSMPEVFIRDAASIPNKEPLAIINGYIPENNELLAQLKLSDVNKIFIHKPHEETSALYGARGRYGVIVIEINKRKLKKIRRLINN